MLWITRSLAGTMLLVLVSAAQAQVSRSGRELGWRFFEVPDFGTTVQYPAGIFTSVGKAEKGIGEQFESEDGRAVLSVYSFPNELGETPTSYLRDNLRMRPSALDYTRVTRFFLRHILRGERSDPLQPVQFFPPIA
jgi:hypothetical protein